MDRMATPGLHLGRRFQISFQSVSWHKMWKFAARLHGTATCSNMILRTGNPDKPRENKAHACEMRLKGL